MSVKLGVVVGIPCEGGDVHGVVTIVFQQELMKLGFLWVTGVNVFADVVDGMVVQ